MVGTVTYQSGPEATCSNDDLRSLAGEEIGGHWGRDTVSRWWKDGGGVSAAGTGDSGDTKQGWVLGSRGLHNISSTLKHTYVFSVLSSASYAVPVIAEAEALHSSIGLDRHGPWNNASLLPCLSICLSPNSVALAAGWWGGAFPTCSYFYLVHRLTLMNE